MKKSFVTLLILHCFLSISIAQLSYDTLYKRTYYEQKVSQFKLLKQGSIRPIVFLGDSITDMGEWAELFGSTNVLNRGISSDITFGVLNRLDETIARKPSKIFILIGINDIARNIPDSVIVGNYEKIVQQIQQHSPNTKIYIQSILPTNNNFTEFKNHQNKTEHITFINTQLQKIATAYKATYVNIASVLLNDEQMLDSKYTNDGLHLKGEGYMAWKNYLIKNNYCCN
jgi:lysophospholipase L1-like esterase